MEQHPIPQDITSYRFRLVGDMTLKQFLELASGLFFAWFIYSLPLNTLIKWPLVLTVAGFGAALAFLPIEERPLDVWIANFFKAIYQPTQFIWKKTNPLPEFLQTPTTTRTSQKTPVVSSRDRQKLEEYLSSLPQKEEEVDKKEKSELEKISQFFKEAGLFLKKDKEEPPAFYEPRLTFEKIAREGALPTTIEPRLEPVMIPPTPKISLQAQAAAQKDYQGPPVVELATPVAPPLQVKTEVVYKKPEETAVTAEENPSLPMPSTPTLANILTGMTLNTEEEILPDTIIEIQDKNDYPVRALKSNKLGQFFITTPLPNGEYKIEVEHPEYKFAIMKVVLKNQIIPPIKIKAKERIA